MGKFITLEENNNQLTIQILHYEFLGPIEISEWGPPMGQLVYLLFSKTKNGFNLLYASQVEKTDKTDFFTQNDKFKCWIQHAGSEEMLYLAVYPMSDSQASDRERVVQQIISKYRPPCNTD